MAVVDVEPVERRRRARRLPTLGNHGQLSDGGFGLLVAVPALAVLLTVFVYPLGYSIYQSLREYDLARPKDAHFIGLDNYRTVLQSRDFSRALRNTTVYTVVAVPIELVAGLVLALSLAQITHGRAFIRTILTVPMMLAPIAMGLTWRFMYNDQFGVINYTIRQLGIMDRPPLWLSDPKVALYSVIAVEVWATTPVVVLLLLAGLVSIPGDYYEAAQVDGGGTLSSFRNITLPLLKPAILVTLLLRGMDAFRVFDLVYVLTKGGPAFKTDVLSFFAYRLAFTDRSIGGATALAWIMTIILLIAGLILIQAMRRQKETL